MTAPIDIVCPACNASLGTYCWTIAARHYHCAERIDAAARKVPAPPPVKRYQELPDDTLDLMSAESLRGAYKNLRDHHVSETTALVARAAKMRKVYDAALNWRSVVKLAPANHLTAGLIDVIDAALADEVKS